MRAKTTVLSILYCALLGLLVGCSSAPARYIDGVQDVTERHGVADGKARRVEGWPCLRLDAELVDRIDRALAEDDLGLARGLALSFLEDAHRLSAESTRQELERLDDAGWEELATRYFGVSVSPDEATKSHLVDAYLTRTDQHYWFLRHAAEEASSVESLRGVLAPIRANLRVAASERGRSLRRLLLSPFAIPTRIAINGIREDLEAREFSADFEQAFCYRMAEAAPSGPDETPEDWALLVRYAPVIYQEHNPSSDYDPDSDLLGEVVAIDAEHIGVVTERPAVYGYTRSIFVNGSEHRQLVYTLWYPEHPPAYPRDPEAGDIDGVTVRVTLGHDGYVAFVETVANCGCYHGIYPARRLDDAAAEEFGPPVPGHRYSIERDLAGAAALDVPGLLVGGVEDTPLTFWCAAQQHLVVDVSLAPRAAPTLSGEMGYTLYPYAHLETLGLPGGGVTSMFHANGLVKGAERREGVLLAASGMLSAGQPRQRGTQLILFDAYDFDDPRLLEKTMRLPSGF